MFVKIERKEIRSQNPNKRKEIEGVCEGISFLTSVLFIQKRVFCSRLDSAVRGGS